MSILPGGPALGDQPLWNALLSVYALPCITAAQELGLFETLEPGPLSVEVAAAKLRADQRALDIVAGQLAAQSLIAREGDHLALTPQARAHLLPQSPTYWGGMLRHPLVIAAGTHKPILKALRGEQLSRADLVGPEESGWSATEDTHAMHAHSASMALALASRGVFRETRRMLDIGGGSGCYSIAAAKQQPELSALVLDLEAVCPTTRQFAAKAGMSQRVHVEALDVFNNPWPEGFDTVFISDLVHDFGDETNRRLFERARAALRPGGRILLHEMLLQPTRDGPSSATAYSVMMLLYSKSGRQYTAAELQALLETSGFTDFQTQPASVYFSLVSAVAT